ncbi:hypothetical protein L596_017868 [Steinernema carpocapsae]|uniref:Uncharacterized protein n=1 Tax=Steinernema carpocapsae TaxID=34508 RepID=A0A4U5N2X5_STECR|nr:hypothetical protein L596_017868 [Steinernema carpocapsae]
MHRRTKSWNKRLNKPVMDELMMTPLQVEPTVEITTTTLPTTTIPTPAAAPPAPTASEEPSAPLSTERHRVVSFSTPKKEPKNTEDTESVEEFCITARHHLV